MVGRGSKQQVAMQRIIGPICHIIFVLSHCVCERLQVLLTPPTTVKCYWVTGRSPRGCGLWADKAIFSGD
jgi:hypothetical protein